MQSQLDISAAGPGADAAADFLKTDSGHNLVPLVGGNSKPSRIFGRQIDVMKLF
jgi:hypothetical protein